MTTEMMPESSVFWVPGNDGIADSAAATSIQQCVQEARRLVKLFGKPFTFRHNNVGILVSAAADAQNIISRYEAARVAVWDRKDHTGKIDIET